MLADRVFAEHRHDLGPDYVKVGVRVGEMQQHVRDHINPGRGEPVPEEVNRA